MTIWNVRRSKRAAEAAESAAREARRTILKFDIVEDLSAAVAILEEIKRLHRARAWAVVPDRYTVLRKLLSSTLAANPGSRNEHRAAIVSLVGHLKGMETAMDKALAAGESPKNLPRLNEVLSEHADKLNLVLMEIRAQEE